MFEVNDKDTRTTSNDVKRRPGVFIVIFEQFQTPLSNASNVHFEYVNVCWVVPCTESPNSSFIC